MTESPGFTLNLHENKQGQTFALVLQKDPRLCVCVPSPHPHSLLRGITFILMRNLEIDVSRQARGSVGSAQRWPWVMDGDVGRVLLHDSARASFGLSLHIHVHPNSKRTLSTPHPLEKSIPTHQNQLCFGRTEN